MHLGAPGTLLLASELTAFPTQEGRLAWSLCNAGKASASLGLSDVCLLEALSLPCAGTAGEADEGSGYRVLGQWEHVRAL